MLTARSFKTFFAQKCGLVAYLYLCSRRSDFKVEFRNQYSPWAVISALTLLVFCHDLQLLLFDSEKITSKV